MEQKRLIQILQVTIANMCDHINGYSVDTKFLMELHGELQGAENDVMIKEYVVCIYCNKGHLTYAGQLGDEPDKYYKCTNCNYHFKWPE